MDHYIMSQRTALDSVTVAHPKYFIKSKSSPFHTNCWGRLRFIDFFRCNCVRQLGTYSLHLSSLRCSVHEQLIRSCLLAITCKLQDRNMSMRCSISTICTWFHFKHKTKRHFEGIDLRALSQMSKFYARSYKRYFRK